MKFKEKLKEHVINLINDVFTDETTIFFENQLLNSALKGISEQDSLYEIYRDDKSLKRDINKDIKKLRELEKLFVSQLKRAKNCMENNYTSNYSYTHQGTSNNGFFRFINYNKPLELDEDKKIIKIKNITTLRKYDGSKYRFACNIEISKFSKFIEHFLIGLYVVDHKCPNCNFKGKFLKQNNQIKLPQLKELNPDNKLRNEWGEYLICPSCGKYPQFSFKIFPKSQNILRRDKSVIYLRDEYTMKFVLPLLRDLRKWFDKNTPLLTKEIFPGLGVALEHTMKDLEKDILKRDEKSTTKLISFGTFITKIIMQNLIEIIPKHRKLVEDSLATLDWCNEGKELMNIRKGIFEKLKPLITELAESTVNDPRVKNYIDAMDNIHDIIKEN